MVDMTPAYCDCQCCRLAARKDGLTCSVYSFEVDYYPEEYDDLY